MTRLIQIKEGFVRRMGLVDEPHVRLLDGSSIYELAQTAVDVPNKLSEVAHQRRRSDKLDCELSIGGVLPWQMLPRIDPPQVSSCGLISGTALPFSQRLPKTYGRHEDVPVGSGGRALTDKSCGVEKSKPGIVKVVG